MTNLKAYIHRWTDDITLTDMRIKGTEKSFKSKRKKKQQQQIVMKRQAANIQYTNPKQKQLH